MAIAATVAPALIIYTVLSSETHMDGQEGRTGWNRHHEWVQMKSYQVPISLPYLLVYFFGSKSSTKPITTRATPSSYLSCCRATSRVTRERTKTLRPHSCTLEAPFRVARFDPEQASPIGRPSSPPPAGERPQDPTLAP